MLTSERTFAGWFAKDPKVLGQVGHVLLQLPYAVSRSPRQIVIADDCLQKVKIPVDRIAQVVIKSSEKLFGSKLFFPSFRYLFYDPCPGWTGASLFSFCQAVHQSPLSPLLLSLGCVKIFKK